MNQSSIKNYEIKNLRERTLSVELPQVSRKIDSRSSYATDESFNLDNIKGRQ